jgi:phosphatidylserine/phosphatidylglycerophosphate/cardiolipin synthase-like enzyme
LIRAALILKPSTLLRFHGGFKDLKYRFHYSSRPKKKPGPKGPAPELLRAICELKQRNAGFGCPKSYLVRSVSGRAAQCARGLQQIPRPEHATNTVLVQAYSFTSAPVARALVDAQHRGVKVQAILDKSRRTEKYSEADFLKNEGVPTSIDAQHAIAHNKIMILDGYLVLTGSFNFTKAAEENNAENLLVINDPVLAKRYIENWHAHESHSEGYERADRSEPRPGIADESDAPQRLAPGSPRSSRPSQKLFSETFLCHNGYWTTTERNVPHMNNL